MLIVSNILKLYYQFRIIIICKVLNVLSERYFEPFGIVCYNWLKMV